MVHLRGKGKAVIRSRGRIRSLAIRDGESMQIPEERLVGWLGNLTPSLTGTELTRWVHLQGEGSALWSTPATP